MVKKIEVCCTIEQGCFFLVSCRVAENRLEQPQGDGRLIAV